MYYQRLRGRWAWNELRVLRIRHPRWLPSHYKVAGRSLHEVPTPMLKAWGKYHIPRLRRRPSVLVGSAMLGVEERGACNDGVVLCTSSFNESHNTPRGLQGRNEKHPLVPIVPVRHRIELRPAG